MISVGNGGLVNNSIYLGIAQWTKKREGLISPMFYEVLAADANVAKPPKREGKDMAQTQPLHEPTALFISVFQEPFSAWSYRK